VNTQAQDVLRSEHTSVAKECTPGARARVGPGSLWLHSHKITSNCQQLLGNLSDIEEPKVSEA